LQLWLCGIFGCLSDSALFCHFAVCLIAFLFFFGSLEDLTAGSARLTTEIKNLEMGVAENQEARLNTEIENLEMEVAENQEDLDQATEIRQKDFAKFNAKKKGLLGSISALTSAVTVLSKDNSARGFVIGTGSMSAITSGVEAAMVAQADLLKGVLTHKQRRAVTAFLQSPRDYFDAEPTFKQSYAPQSGEIFGILKQMKETFETNLEQTRTDEQNKQKAYEELKAAKEEEIEAVQELIDEKTQELASTDEKLAESEEDLEDTKESLAAHEEFLAMLKENCSGTDPRATPPRTTPRMVDLMAQGFNEACAARHLALYFGGGLGGVIPKCCFVDEMSCMHHCSLLHCLIVLVFVLSVC